jgi:hypothetical protein
MSAAHQENLHMIKPTIGRRVWYWPLPHEMSFAHSQPFDAGICHVWSDTCVNLSVVNEQGYAVPSKTSVTLTQDRPAMAGECSWMPYQTIQAK